MIETDTGQTGTTDRAGQSEPPLGDFYVGGSRQKAGGCFKRAIKQPG